MIDIEIPKALIWALRWALFLGPMAALVVFCWRKRHNERQLTGALFSFLYGIGTVFATHQVAIYAGLWTYGGNSLMLMGMPADILIGGAILFGPVLYMAFPKTKPLYIVLPIILGLHGTVFSSLKPLIYAGDNWFVGIALVFMTAHIPAIYLARWTAEDRLLPLRVAVLAVGFGFLAFAVLPSLIMSAMGGNWNFADIPIWRYLIGLPLLCCSILIGLSAVQMFVVHGDGTAIPLDPTKRLVRTGIYAYVSNPMQLCSAIGWISIGFMISNIWVASAAIMAWVFVAGMVRWHHRNDLLLRFPKDWPTYQKNVPEWLPRWRPWIPKDAMLYCDPDDPAHARLVSFLQSRSAINLDVQKVKGATLRYIEPGETRGFEGVAATAKALNHLNFFWCLIGAGILLVVLPKKYLREKLLINEGVADANTTG